MACDAASRSGSATSDRAGCRRAVALGREVDTGRLAQQVLGFSDFEIALGFDAERGADPDDVGHETRGEQRKAEPE